jgi:hypothetical protein
MVSRRFRDGTVAAFVQRDMHNRYASRLWTGLTDCHIKGATHPNHSHRRNYHGCILNTFFSIWQQQSRKSNTFLPTVVSDKQTAPDAPAACHFAGRWSRNFMPQQCGSMLRWAHDKWSHCRTTRQLFMGKQGIHSSLPGDRIAGPKNSKNIYPLEQFLLSRNLLPSGLRSPSRFSSRSR